MKDDPQPRPAREVRQSGKVLSLELGFSCNARCGFCPQLHFRADPRGGFSPDLTTEEVRERLRFGAEQGYSHLGLSGGEPTLRSDLVELLAYARALGYQHLSITTNGLRLAYPAYAEALVRAGLRGVNVSVHGHTAALHDGLMRTPGAFDLALKALENLGALRRRGAKLDLMSMCLSAPAVLPHFAEHVRLMGRMGVRLHMLQPFAMYRGNTRLARHYLSTYDEMTRAIAQGVAAAAEHGGHVKLFNTPVCGMWELAPKLERQWRRLDAFRDLYWNLENRSRDERPTEEGASSAEARPHAVGPARETPIGFFRVDACRTCDEPCSGFRAEYYPQDLLAAEVEAAMDAHQRRFGRGPLWVGGLELCTPETLGRVLSSARARTPHLTYLTAGIGRAHVEQYREAVRAGVDELCFAVHHPESHHTRVFSAIDRSCAVGNMDFLAEGAGYLRQLSEGPRPRLSATLLLRDLVVRPALAAELRALGIDKLRCAGMTEGDAAIARGPFWRELPGAEAALAGLRADGFEVVLLADPVHGEAGLAVEDEERAFVRHRFLTTEFLWLNWSVPGWANLAEAAAFVPTRGG